MRSLLRIIEVSRVVLGDVPGALVVVFSKRKQRMGDILAETLVVRSQVDGSLLARDNLAIDDLQGLPEPDMAPDDKYSP